MLRLLIDENFNHRILRGLKSRLPELDFVLVGSVGLTGSEDRLLLRWAVRNDRTILTQDLKTMVPDAEQLLRQGEPMAGVIAIPQSVPIGRAIDELELTIACYSQEELRDQIKHLPL